MKKLEKIFLALYGIASILLFLYSYTQVDLNLTLSRVSIWQTIQKSFQYIGYFRRPLSTEIYLFILAVFFVLYIWTLRAVASKKLDERGLWRLILTVTILLVFSYPAFSNDMFNYMFTAKTVLIYHKNPYVLIPMQLSGVEPWIMFMRWVHLTSAYTPLWIALTLPAYLLGFGYFLLIMWNIKVLVALFYLATIWLIGKSLNIVEPKNKMLGMAIFALNPLIIVESLVSSHNDITMMAVAVLAYYLFLTHKKWGAWFTLSVSAAFKLMTVFLIPVHFLKWNRLYALGFMLLGLALVIMKREFLPWYWVWIMPFVALLPGRRDITLLA
ncbi:hypothetical protein HY031_01735, partial [Candidatus Gottesmanbacteria bacterium]|nr:hypothetical protein [Candidatus Gottesmanbacteria bacterium]